MKFTQFFIALSLTFMAIGAQAEIKSGMKAHQFTLKGDDGKSHNLTSQKGKYIILEWYNDGCPYVKKYYNSGRMQELQKQYTSRDVVWYSVISSKEGEQGHVDVDGAKKLRKDRKSHSTAILLDPDGKVGRMYGAKTTPHMFVIDPQGVVLYQGAIDDQPSANKKTLEVAKNYLSSAFADIDSKKPVKTADTQPYGCSVKY